MSVLAITINQLDNSKNKLKHIKEAEDIEHKKCTIRNKIEFENLKKRHSIFNNSPDKISFQANNPKIKLNKLEYKESSIYNSKNINKTVNNLDGEEIVNNILIKNLKILQTEKLKSNKNVRMINNKSWAVKTCKNLNNYNINFKSLNNSNSNLIVLKSVNNMSASNSKTGGILKSFNNNINNCNNNVKFSSLPSFEDNSINNNSNSKKKKNLTNDKFCAKQSLSSMIYNLSESNFNYLESNENIDKSDGFNNIKFTTKDNIIKESILECSLNNKDLPPLLLKQKIKMRCKLYNEPINEIGINKEISNTRNFCKFNNILDSESELEIFSYFDFKPKWYSIHPKSSISIINNSILDWMIVLTLIVFPLELVNISLENTSNYVFHIILEIVLVISHIITFIIGYYEPKRRQINFNIMHIVNHKYKSSNVLFFIYEQIVIFFNIAFFDFMCLVFNVYYSKDSIIYNYIIISKFLLFLNLNNWIQINPILNTINNLMLISANKKNKDIKKTNYLIHFYKIFAVIRVLVYYMLLIHIGSCLWILTYLTEKKQFKNDHWVNNMNISEDDFTTIYISSYYFCLTTLLSVGYGDIRPFNNKERYFAIIFMAIGVLFYSFLVTLISSVVVKRETKRAMFSQKLAILDNLNSSYNIDDKLYTRIYNTISHSTEQFNADKLLVVESLPSNLKDAVLLTIYDKRIKGLDFLYNVKDKNFVLVTCGLLNTQVYDKNCKIIQAYQRITEVYFIIKGEITLCLDEEYDCYKIAKIFKREHFMDYLIDKGDYYSPYTLETGRSVNEILTLTKENYISLKLKFPRCLNKIREDTKFKNNIIEELKNGAINYFKIYQQLFNYYNFSMKRINNEIKKELGLFDNNELISIDNNLKLPSKKISNNAVLSHFRNRSFSINALNSLAAIASRPFSQSNKIVSTYNAEPKSHPNNLKRPKVNSCNVNFRLPNSSMLVNSNSTLFKPRMSELSNASIMFGNSKHREHRVSKFNTKNLFELNDEKAKNINVVKSISIKKSNNIKNILKSYAIDNKKIDKSTIYNAKDIYSKRFIGFNKIDDDFINSNYNNLITKKKLNSKDNYISKPQYLKKLVSRSNSNFSLNEKENNRLYKDYINNNININSIYQSYENKDLSDFRKNILNKFKEDEYFIINANTKDFFNITNNNSTISKKYTCNICTYTIFNKNENNKSYKNTNVSYKFKNLKNNEDINNSEKVLFKNNSHCKTKSKIIKNLKYNKIKNPYVIMLNNINEFYHTGYNIEIDDYLVENLNNNLGNNFNSFDTNTIDDDSKSYDISKSNIIITKSKSNTKFLLSKKEKKDIVYHKNKRLISKY